MADLDEKKDVDNVLGNNVQFSIDDEHIPEDLIREKVKWELEEAERRLKIDEEKAARELEQPLSSLKGLPEELLRAKILSDINIADRKMKLEELKVENDILLENKIESFKQAQSFEMIKIVNKDDYQSWIRKYWRAAAGWTYLFICLFDFVIAPIFFAIIPVWTHVQYNQWTSLTLSNGGLMHISFGAILGVAAWTRGQGDLMRAKIASDKMGVDDKTTGS